METLIVKTKTKSNAEKIIKILQIMDAKADYIDSIEDKNFGQMIAEGMKSATLNKNEKKSFLKSLGE